MIFNYSRQHMQNKPPFYLEMETNYKFDVSD